MIAVYLCHPYSDDPERNRASAKRWVAMLGLLGYLPMATWITLTEQWTEALREHGLAIDCAQIERSNVVLVVGRYISSGMAVEIAHARKMGIPVVEMLGADLEDDGVKLELCHRINQAAGVA